MTRAPAAPSWAGDPLLSGLSPEQVAVVLSPPGPLLVLAGAGSGKTRALTHRVAYFLANGVAPERLLLVTFTNQAARSLLHRLAQLGWSRSRVDRDALWLGTFHHLALRVLRQHGHRIGLSDRFVVLDRGESADLIAACMDEVAVSRDRPWPRPAQLQSLLSLSLNSETTLEQTLAQQAPELMDSVSPLSQVYERYTARKLRMGLCDFDDLLLGWRLLLCDQRVVRDEQRGRFQHLFVDEFQDTSRIQCAIIEDIAQGYRSLTAVGDDAQSIYGFRGAQVGNIHDFPRRWPDAKVLYLSTNYRSAPDIVSLSNQAVARQPSSVPRPPMRSGRPEEPRVIPALIALPDVRLQARFVVQRIVERIASGVRPADIAVLYRSHRHARELQVELLRCQIPHVVHSGQRISEQAHVRDTLAFLRLCHNPQDRIAWTRVLRQVAGLGDTGRARILGELDGQFAAGESIADLNDRLLRHARGDSKRGLQRLFALLAELRELSRRDPGKEHMPARLLSHVLDRHYRDYARRAFADADSRLVDLDGLCRRSDADPLPPGGQQPSLPLSSSDTLSAFLASATLGEELEPRSRGDEQAVVLSSIHQAKGLEWRIVFVVWLAEGFFPTAAALGDAARGSWSTPRTADPGSIAEEHRLFYVAITRARDELYLCHPQTSGPTGLLRRSRFLDELDHPTAPLERWRIQVEQPNA
ncbi:MAG TPA: ATP-dependent helicase [Pseudomonadota bacterium]|nr:ATP-dependent helicase [Pseudomonadota bacterium]